MGAESGRPARVDEKRYSGRGRGVNWNVEGRNRDLHLGRLMCKVQRVQVVKDEGGRDRDQT